MSSGNHNSGALFQTIKNDGTCWLFVIRGDNGWAIIRDDQQVAFGTSDKRSIDFGVRRYMQLTSPPAPLNSRRRKIVSIADAAAAIPLIATPLHGSHDQQTPVIQWSELCELSEFSE